MAGVGASDQRLAPPPPPPPPPPTPVTRPQANTAQPATQPLGRTPTPVEAGAQARRNDELATLQKENFPEYVKQLAPTLSPEDRANPFAYSLDHNIPIEVKRQVFAEYKSGANAPRVEVGSLAGSNATYTEQDGPNGTIRINGDLLGNTDPARRGQLEAFAAWGHMEEVGHWADARAQRLMGTPGGDSAGDEGARYALLASGQVAAGADSKTRLASYDIPAVDGTRRIQVDTGVLKALGAEKLANGSFARENRVGNVENFGPEGHYQTTYITAANAAKALGYLPAEADTIANRLALGSQLLDMLENFDAASQATAKLWSTIGQGGIPPGGPILWTPQDQRHLESVYEGLHALPRAGDANPGWVANERAETANFIRDRIAAGDYLTAGVAIHRYGDLHAHIKPDGTPYSGDLGHLFDGHSPDYLYTAGPNQRPQAWSKATDYQASLSNVLAEGLAARQRALGQTVTPDAPANAARAAQSEWRQIYDSALSTSASRNKVIGRGIVQGVGAKAATEDYFAPAAANYIQRFHDRAGGRYNPLPLDQTGTDGGYRPSPGEIGSLNRVMETFDAFH